MKNPNHIPTSSNGPTSITITHFAMATPTTDGNVIGMTGIKNKLGKDKAATWRRLECIA